MAAVPPGPAARNAEEEEEKDIIMRKQLLALLSMFGLAGSTTPASAQVLNGSKPADTKNESTAKLSKANAENAAATDTKIVKIRKAGGESNAVRKDATKKVLIGLSEPQKSATQDASHKGSQDKLGNSSTTSIIVDKRRKADAENAAAKAEDIIHGSGKANAQMGDGSVRPNTQKTTIGSATGGAGAGKVKMEEFHTKGNKSAAESQTLKQDANKKAVKQQGEQPKQ